MAVWTELLKREFLIGLTYNYSLSQRQTKLEMPFQSYTPNLKGHSKIIFLYDLLYKLSFFN